MTQSLRILHIEDIESDAELIDRTLRRSGIAFEKLVVDTKAEYLEALEKFDPDVILSDHSLPAFNSLEALKLLKQREKNIPFILITATVSEEFAVNVMKEGASDYVLKDRLQRLPNAILNAIGKYQSDNERQIYLDRIFASEALFTKAESLAEFGTWRMDMNNTFTTWSAGTYRLLGYENGEVDPSMENFLRNIHPEDTGKIKDLFKDMGFNTEPAEADVRVINKDGSVRFLHMQFEFELNDRNEPAHIIGFSQDVTRRTLAQIEIQENIAELKAASDRQSDILNAMPPNMVLLNEAGKIVAVNDAWIRFTLANNLGVPRHGIGFSYLAISEKATGVDPVSEKQIARGIKEIIEGERDEFSMEYSYYSDHKKVWFQLLVAPLTDKTKKGAVVLHIDITDRKEAEELMLQSKANLQTIFENTDIAYVLCNAEQKVVSFNTKANELCLEQFNKKLKTGANAFSYFPKNKIPNLKEAIQKISNNEMVSYETSYDLRDGGVKWYEVRWVGIGNALNEHTGFMVAFKDITGRKISELERDRITADLVQRNKDLEQFTYIVSHNLRAPVANIKGLSNMLNSFDFNINESQEIKTSLATSIDVLDGMIMDLNHILQVRHDVRERREDIYFSALVDDIKMSLHNFITKQHVVIKCDFAAVNKIVKVKSYMHSIFYNLILNAIKYSRPDTDPVITIFTRKNANNMEIFFKDNGKGIDARNMKDLFGLYKRFDTSVEGKGMGLFMVKMQVESIGGTIDVESELGKGTTFRVTFPDA